MRFSSGRHAGLAQRRFSTHHDQYFSIAYEVWDLDRLCLHLKAVGKPLSPTYQAYLRGVLCSKTSKEIATELCVTPGRVRVVCSECYAAIRALTREANVNHSTLEDILKKYGFHKIVQGKVLPLSLRSLQSNTEIVS